MLKKKMFFSSHHGWSFSHHGFVVAPGSTPQLPCLHYQPNICNVLLVYRSSTPSSGYILYPSLPLFFFNTFSLRGSFLTLVGTINACDDAALLVPDCRSFQPCLCGESDHWFKLKYVICQIRFAIHQAPVLYSWHSGKSRVS